MDREGGGSDASERPAAKKARAEVNPDLPLDASSIPSVQALIRRNNAETRPRKRLRLMEFLNATLFALGREAVTNRARVEDALALFDEFVGKYGATPRSTTMAAVFYTWLDGGMEGEALQLLHRLLRARDRVPSAVFQSCFDEKVTTVTLRIATSAAAVEADPLTTKTGVSRKDLIEVLLSCAPQESLRRRVFSPLLVYGRQEKDWSFTARMLAMALERDIELWDEDYHDALCTIEASRAGDASSEAMDRLETVLGMMSEHHPVVGAENAAIVQRIAGGSMGCSVSATGECSRCKQTLSSFDLTESDRIELLRDIEEKLILPRIEGVSRYEPTKKVTEETRTARLAEYEAFKRDLADMTYDTVIDGANVGYYGLNSWYAEAKREELMAKHPEHNTLLTASGEEAQQGTGRAATSMSASLLATIPSHPPFPVDVAPKFALIDSIRQEAAKEGRRPLIILHSRHTSSGTPENMSLLASWRKQRSFLASPAFLNDDYCWLYAAVVRPSTFVVSNDQMRDHHFLMLSPRFFVRWRQRHRITYRVLHSPDTRVSVPRIHMPRCYSVWVQRAVVHGVRHWHIPYRACIPILDQATNRTTKTSADVELSKDGDDDCSDWVCTSPVAGIAARERERVE